MFFSPLAASALDVHSQIGADMTFTPLDDTIVGTDGADTLEGGSGSQWIYGLNGDDLLSGGNDRDYLSGGGGQDTLSGGAGADDLRGEAGDDQLFGGMGYDWLAGGHGNDTLDGGGGRHDLADYWAPEERFELSIDLAAGTETDKFGSDVLIDIQDVRGNDGDNQIFGDSQDNNLVGFAGNDLIVGRKGVDGLQGMDGDDTIIGGKGADQLTGGAGADTFVYTSAKEAFKGGAEWIFDLEQQDLIDLSAIDADVHSKGDQAFHIVQAFDGHAGELVLSHRASPDWTDITADTNGDGLADFHIIVGNGDLSGFTNFVL